MRRTLPAGIYLFLVGASFLYGQNAYDGCKLYACVDFSGEAFPTVPVLATSVSIGNPTGIAVDAAGNVYIAGPSIVFKLDAAGMLSRVAGNGHNGYSGDGGLATDALLGFPRASPLDPIDFSDVVGALAVDSSDNLYIADFFNNRVRKVTREGLISTVAGNGQFPLGCGSNCLQGGEATQASLAWPGGIAADSTGRLYVTDSYRTLWQVTPDGIIAALMANNCGSAGSAGLCVPYGVAADALGNVYIADTGNCRIQRLGLDGSITTGAGPTTLTGSLFPCGYSGDDGPATFAVLSGPYGVATDASGNLYIADTYNNRIRKVFAPDGIVTTVAGSGPSYGYSYHGGYSGDGGPATSAELNLPHSVAVDTAGNIYIADSENYRVRKVSPDGIITTVAGNGFWGSISASPNPCVLSGSLCTSYITWSTTGLSKVQVWVRVGTGPDSLFATATSCSGTDCAAPWIQGGDSVYTFTLYDCSSVICTDTNHGNAPVVGSVRVTGVQGTPTVRIVDNSTSSLTTLAVGDSFSFLVTGAPPFSLVFVSEPGWSGSLGYTDSSGSFRLSGTVAANVVGTWQQTWTIGGVVAQPSPLQFTITQPWDY